jgi:trypsin-like peptidase
MILSENRGPDRVGARLCSDRGVDMQVGCVAVAVGLIVGSVAALAQESAPPAATAAQPVAVKKPPAKKSRVAARPSRDASEILAEAPSFSLEAVGWQLTEDAKTGARLGVPTKLVPHSGFSRSGSRWTSAQGQIQVETFRLTEAALPALFEEEKKASHRQITASVLKPDSFVVLGVQGLKDFLVRADAHGSEVRGVTVLYDQATEGTMERVATAVANSFVAFPDPNAAPPPGVRRLVEYGSAIVVGADGDLLTTAHGTDDCQAITVPPFGHAERVAADAASDLALIRLYGARHLAPAALADDAGAGGELKLLGVADPLAAATDGGVTASTVRLVGQAIEPAPRPGFSGAAALDARGRLVGVVDLKPAVVAGGGAAGQAATLVPVEPIRALLRSQRIAPAVAGAAMTDQSVLRVICVRK